MTKRNNAALAIGIILVIVAALVAIFNQSRTFPQIMGQSYASAKVESIHIYLSPMQNGLPTRELTLTQEDPAAQDLLNLVGAGEGHQILLDYTVYMTLSMEPEGEAQAMATVALDGSKYMDIDGLDRGSWNGNWVRTHYRADLAFQQEVLDLLLAQPYEEVQEA